MEAEDNINLAVNLFFKTVTENIPVTHKKENCREVISAILEHNNTVYKNEILIHPDLATFYKKEVIANDEKIIDTCCETVSQSSCPKWFEERKLRLSASSNIHSVKSRRSKTIDKLVNDMLSSVKISTDATKYGKEKEPVARKFYEEVRGVQVVEVGVLIKRKQSWLCASSDGVVIENGAITMNFLQGC